MLSSFDQAILNFTGGVDSVFYRDNDGRDFSYLASFFGIWHESGRGESSDLLQRHECQLMR